MLGELVKESCRALGDPRLGTAVREGKAECDNVRGIKVKKEPRQKQMGEVGVNYC